MLLLTHEISCQCDAGRPCQPCQRRSLDCVYATESGETHSRALKRKYTETAQSRDTYAELYGKLISLHERDAAEVIRHMRNGLPPADVLKFARSLRSVNSAPPASKSERVVHESLLIRLAHSTASLRDVVHFAIMVLNRSDSAGDAMPLKPVDHYVLRNRIVHLRYLEDIVQRADEDDGRRSSRLLDDGRGSADRATPADSNRSQSVWDDTSDDDSIPHRVPAAPWMSISADDEAISHLVSLYFAWINPTWRFLEADLFLQGKRITRAQSSNRRFALLRDKWIDRVAPSPHRHALEATGFGVLLTVLGQQHLCPRECECWAPSIVSIARHVADRP